MTLVKNRSKIIGGSLILITAVLLTTVYFMNSSNSSGISNISAKTAHDMIENDDDYPDLIVLDVRTTGEFEGGHIEGAINIPSGELEGRIAELSQYKDVEIIVHCASGHRSASSVGILVDGGFTKIYNMENGLSEWIDEGYPII